MKILIVAPNAPFPMHSGQRIRISQEILHLAKEQHIIGLVYFAYNKKDLRLPPYLTTTCHLILPVQYEDKSGVDSKNVPRMINAYRQTSMRLYLELVNSSFQPDVVIFEHIYMAQYEDVFTCKKILIEHNIESNVLKRAASLFEQTGQIISPNSIPSQPFRNSKRQACLMHDYEDLMWPKFKHKCVVSPIDKAVMDGRCGVTTSLLVPNGVDTADSIFKSNAKLTTFYSILFLGTLDYYPNIDAIDWLLSEIMPLVWKNIKNVTLTIAGRNPSIALRKSIKDERVILNANPDSIKSAAEKSDFTVVPLRIGGGSRLKILDSLSLGLPVISTAIGAEGLELVKNQHLLIEDDSSSFANAICELLQDPLRRRRMSIAGRRLVVKKYDWNVAFKPLDGLLESFN